MRTYIAVLQHPHTHTDTQTQSHLHQGQQEGCSPTLPAAIVPCSALDGEGLPALRRALEAVLDEVFADGGFDYDRRPPTVALRGDDE